MSLLRAPLLLVAVVWLSSLPVRGDTDTDKKAIALGKAMDVGAQNEKIRVAGEFAKMGESARVAAKSLAKACTDSNQKVSVAAFEAMEKVWPELAEAGTWLVSDKNEQFNISEKRTQACQTILGLGSDAGVPFLVYHFRTRVGVEEDFFRVNSSLVATAEALAKLAPDDATFHKTLMLAAGPANKKNRNRVLALKTLGELVEMKVNTKLRKEAIPLFRSTIMMVPNSPSGRNYNQEQLADFRGAAVTGLGNCGRDAKVELQTLKTMKFKDESETVRKLAAEAVAKIESDTGK